MKKPSEPFIKMAASLYADSKKAKGKSSEDYKSKHGFLPLHGAHAVSLSPKDVAARLGVSEKTLERWRREGKGPPFVKVSYKRVRYMVKELDAWIDANMMRMI